MPPLARPAVEVPMLAMFEQDAFDYEATRRYFAEQLDARITETTAQAERAEREVAELRAQADRIRGDYRRGKLDADEYGSLRAEIAEELDAAEAQARQYAAHAAAAESERGNVDAESETQRRLAELREAIAAAVRDANGDVGALHTAIAQVFGRAWVVADPFRPGEYGVLPEPRPEMTNRADGLELPAERLNRVPVALGGDNQHGTLVWKYMTQKTRRPL